MNQINQELISKMFAIESRTRKIANIALNREELNNVDKREIQTYIESLEIIFNQVKKIQL